MIFRGGAMGEQIGVAMVGCGQIAEAHLKAVAALAQARLVCTVDVDETRAHSAAEQYGATGWTTDYEEALSNPEVDAVVLCLPHDLHLPFSVQAAVAGKHILVEKPMALSEAEAREMVVAAKVGGVHLSVGQSTRFMAPFQKARALQLEGRIGRVVNVLHQRAFFIERLSTDWRRDTAACGGLYLPLFGSHDVDAMLWLLDDTPSRVWGSVQAHSLVSDGDSDGVIGLDFADGKVASIAFSTRCNRRRFEMVFVGEAGTLTVTRNELFVDGDRVDLPETEGAFVLQMRRFVEALLSGKEPPTPGYEVVRVMRVLDLVRESSDRGLAVAF
jgi:predicted dehydrogenase